MSSAPSIVLSGRDRIGFVPATLWLANFRCRFATTMSRNCVVERRALAPALPFDWRAFANGTAHVLPVRDRGSASRARFRGQTQS